MDPLKERLPGGLRQPDLLAGVDVREHPDDRAAVTGRVGVPHGVVFLARDLAHPLEALPRDEHVPGDQGNAAGAAQARDIPVVDDLQVAHRHDARDRLDLAGRVERQCGEELPLAVPGAAVEPPLAGHQDAVFGDLTLAVRHQGAADPHVRAVSKDLILDPVRKVRDRPALRPPGGRAEGRDPSARPSWMPTSTTVCMSFRSRRIAWEPACARRGADHRVDHLVGQPPVLLTPQRIRP